MARGVKRAVNEFVRNRNDRAGLTARIAASVRA
jgi:hypothetical protein